jgi:hypothetical protein
MRKFIPLLLTFLFFITPIKVYGETDNNLDLTVSAKKVSFDFVNIKPGDSVTERFTISNKGVGDFNYLVMSKSNNNNLLYEDKLFQQLDVEIKDCSGRNLYKGKLHKLKDGFGPNLLKSRVNEEITFCFIVPYELGNEFQGQETHFYIKFYVEGTLGGFLPASLPATGQRLPALMGIVAFIAASLGITIGGIHLITYIKKKKIKHIYKSETVTKIDPLK